MSGEFPTGPLTCHEPGAMTHPLLPWLRPCVRLHLPRCHTGTLQTAPPWAGMTRRTPSLPYCPDPVAILAIARPLPGQTMA